MPERGELRWTVHGKGENASKWRKAKNSGGWCTARARTRQEELQRRGIDKGTPDGGTPRNRRDGVSEKLGKLDGRKRGILDDLCSLLTFKYLESRQ